MSTGPIRWLVTDLDGTLVGADLRIVPRSAAALDAFRRSGGEVFLATGRNEASAGRYHAQLGLDTPVIVYNGARVVDLIKRKILYAKEIGAQFATLRSEVLDRLGPHIGAVAFADGEPVVVHDAPSLGEYARRDGLQLRRGDPPGGMPSVTKVLLVSDRPELAGLAAAVAVACPGLVTVSSEPTYLEVLPPGVSKATALRWLAAHRGVDLAQVAAIGDNHNDADMLAAAGLGAAPGGADHQVAMDADLVVGRCEDGAVADLVAHIMERNKACAGSAVTAAGFALPTAGGYPRSQYARRAEPGREENE